MTYTDEKLTKMTDKNLSKMFTLMDQYRKLESDLMALESKLKSERGLSVCLTEFNVDDQNTMESQDENGNPIQRDTIEYWDMMIRQAANAAGFYAEQHGLDINKELGRTIY